VAVAFVVLLAVANLRGVRESGRLFAVPTSGFIAGILVEVDPRATAEIRAGSLVASPVPQSEGAPHSRGRCCSGRERS